MKNFFLKQSSLEIDKTKSSAGFTLIEIMVASSIFIIVMLIVSGAILSVVGANQKSNNLRSVMDNLNLSMESMTRSIRFENYFYCGVNPPSNSSTLDCPAGGSAFSASSDESIYTYSLSGSRILRTKTNTSLGVTSQNYITSPDVNITKLIFKVTGSQPFNSSPGATCSALNNCEQPRVVIIIKGIVTGANTSSSATFSLETAITQRAFDFK